MLKQFFYTACISFFLFHKPSAQTIPVTDNSFAKSYSFVHPVFNRIQNTSGLDTFFQKLYKLKMAGQGTVSVVHIGDSHIQADFLSVVVRNGLQQFFGNAGRGLVFPYQLAQSNAPPDISSSSNIRWQFNRVAHPEIPILYGISGYGIKTDADDASIQFTLRPDVTGPQLFKRLKFFTDHSDANSWALRPADSDTAIVVKIDSGMLYKEVVLDNEVSSFSISSFPSGVAKEFYGVSLENNNSGLLYHTIGVNGARYDHYNDAPLFWQQLTALNADLVIISLGTNEAQAAWFNEASFRQEVSLFIQKIKTAAPNASLLITTAADSYKRKRPNPVLKQVNTALVRYGDQNDIPVWDLYRATNGHGSAYSWSRRGLMNRDRIHFTAEGYRIQGNLLFSALGKGYNSYISNF